MFQGASSPEPSSVYVDLRALRNDRVSLVERGSPHSLCLLESGKLLPGVKVIIANPDTKGQCGDSHLGEVRPKINKNEENGSILAGYLSDFHKIKLNGIPYERFLPSVSNIRFCILFGSFLCRFQKFRLRCFHFCIFV